MDILLLLILVPFKLAYGLMRLISFLDEVLVYFWRPTHNGERQGSCNTGQPQSPPSADELR